MDEARTSLVLDNLDLPSNAAYKIVRRLPQHVTVDDLIQNGRLGLVLAARDYNFARATPFRAYAAARVKGAIYDGLRAVDMVSRYQRDKINAGEAGEPLIYSIERRDLDRSAFNPERQWSHRIDAEACLAAVETPRHQAILRLWTLDGMNGQEVGAYYGITASRARQICGTAVRQVRAKLGVK